jgi:hypothetical protein
MNSPLENREVRLRGLRFAQDVPVCKQSKESL